MKTYRRIILEKDNKKWWTHSGYLMKEDLKSQGTSKRINMLFLCSYMRPLVKIRNQQYGTVWLLTKSRKSLLAVFKKMVSSQYLSTGLHQGDNSQCFPSSGEGEKWWNSVYVLKIKLKGNNSLWVIHAVCMPTASLPPDSYAYSWYSLLNRSI